jgi:hypothetical protein
MSSSCTSYCCGRSSIGCCSVGPIDRRLGTDASMRSLTASRRRRPDHEPKRRSRSPCCPNPAHSTSLRRITRQPAAATAAAQKASRNEETAADRSSLLPASGLPAPPARNHRAASGTKLSEVVSTRNIQAQRPTRAATWLRICAPTATPSPAEKAAAARPAQQLHGVASNELLVDSARCKADRGVRSHHRFGKQSEGEPRAELIERERETSSSSPAASAMPTSPSDS